MRDIVTGAVLLCCLLLLGGCGATGPNLAGVTGGGTLGDPYVLPGENQPNLSQGIEDYLDLDGFWKFNYDSISIQVAGETVAAFGDIIYDTRTDSWTVILDGTNYNLTNSGDIYQSADCGDPGTCVELLVYDEDNVTTQYGTFGRFSRDDGDNVTVAQIYYGLKTPSADMLLTGSATYEGDFIGQIALDEGDIFDATATFTIEANFGTGGIAFATDGGTVDDGGAGTFTLEGAATISGNTYSGTEILGTYSGLEGEDFDLNGALEGAFYGPIYNETAGAISAETEGGDVIYGGFWGTR